MAEKFLPLSTLSPTRPDPDPVVSMTIEIGDGRQGKLAIYCQDDPETLSKQFAATHSLNDLQQQHLAILIRQNMDRFLSKYQTDNQIGPNGQNSILRRSSNIYQRVFVNNKQTKKQSKISALAYNKGKSSHSNYGQVLYKKGQLFLQKKEKTKEEKIQQQTAQEKLTTFTFKPAINEHSNLLSPRMSNSTVNLLLDKKKEYQQNRQHKRAVSDNKIKEQCTFSPRILTKNRQSLDQTSCHQHLYQQAHLRKQRKSLSNLNSLSQFNFQPNSQIMSNPRKKRQSQQQFADRLINSKKLKQDKLEKQRQTKQQLELQQDGKPLFKPSISEFNLKRDSKPIHQKLFAESKQTKPFECNQTLKTSVNLRSNKYFNDFKGKQYAHLFSLLDSDQDGVISADSICIDRVNIKVLDILSPLFVLLDQGKEMGLQEFVGNVESIASKLNVEERRLLLQRPAKLGHSVSETNALVSARSSMLASKKRSLMSTNLHERLRNSKSIAELKLEKHREIMAKELMKECSFKPSIQKKK